jgi:hypothetical protein
MYAKRYIRKILCFMHIYLCSRRSYKKILFRIMLLDRTDVTCPGRPVRNVMSAVFALLQSIATLIISFRQCQFSIPSQGLAKHRMDKYSVHTSHIFLNARIGSRVRLKWLSSRKFLAIPDGDAGVFHLLYFKPAFASNSR